VVAISPSKRVSNKLGILQAPVDIIGRLNKRIWKPWSPVMLKFEDITARGVVREPERSHR
jgi:hypothetical protein